MLIAGTLKVTAVATVGTAGIGTTAPQHRLSVNGTVGAKEVIVTNTGWPDYVFTASYSLMPLSEVAAYIQQHRHLPGIPNGAEVQEKGVSLGEMQAKLLAKIEELTLHVIELDRQNRALEAKVAKLERARPTGPSRTTPVTASGVKMRPAVRGERDRCPAFLTCTVSNSRRMFR